MKPTAARCIRRRIDAEVRTPSLSRQQSAALTFMLVPLFLVAAMGLGTLNRSTEAFTRQASEVAEEAMVVRDLHSLVVSAEAAATERYLGLDPGAGARFEELDAEIRRAFDRIEGFDTRVERHVALTGRRWWERAVAAADQALDDRPGGPTTALPQTMGRFYRNGTEALLAIEGLTIASADELQQAADAARARQRLQTALSLGVFGVSSLTALVLAQWLRHSLHRPLHQLRVAAERFGGQDFSHRVALDSVGDGEMGRVARALNTMAERIFRSNRELLALQRITELSRSAPSPELALGGIAEELASASGCPLVLVHLFDPARHLVTLEVASGFPGRAPGPVAVEVPLAESPLQEVITGGRTTAYAGDGVPEPLRAAGASSFVGVPMVAGGLVVGAIGLAGHDREEAEALRGAAELLVHQVATVYERALADKALMESEERFRTVAETTGELIWSIDTEGRVTYSNNVVRSILGYEPSEILGRHFLELFEPADRSSVAEAVNSHAARREGWSQWTLRLPRKDGGLRWLESTAVPMLDHDGELVGYLGSDRDVTDRLRADEEIRSLNSELEQRVASRTAQLEEANRVLAQREQALARAKTSAERANAAKSEFLSRMSHELRTPLNVILGFGQLLQAECADPGQGECIDEIVRAGQHLLGLITDLLDIAGIEAGALTLSLEPVLVGEVVDEVVDLMRPAARERGSTIEKVPGTEPLYARADRLRLRQVLLNLVSNAVKYDREGGHTVVRAGSPEPGVVRVEVSDTGPGIRPEDADRLFLPFVRLRPDVAQAEGSGLGLAISKALVEAMGGEMGVVVPDGGQGTVFWFSVPQAQPAAMVAEPTTNPGFELVTVENSGHRVLCVDDNSSNVRLIERLLEHRPGVQMMTSASGEPVLDLARRYQPSLVLLDVHLDDLDGEEVLHRLKLDAATEHIPVVVVSADARASQMVRLLDAGASAYLTKPIELWRLLAVLDETLEPAT